MNYLLYNQTNNINICMEKALNDKIWSDYKLIPEIKTRLLEISRKVVSNLHVPVTLKQVLFTGSLASYRWRASSDIDLHIIVELDEKGYEKIAENYFQAYSKIFNDYYSIFVKSYKIEINVKTEEVVLEDKGIYDILKDSWIQKPSIPKKEFEDEEVIELSLYYKEKIDDVVDGLEDFEKVESLRKEIKALRTSGLLEDGEFSTGNMVFKELRHSGYLKRLYDYKQKKESEELSFESFFYNKK
jgi:hypothetical protein